MRRPPTTPGIWPRRVDHVSGPVSWARFLFGCAGKRTFLHFPQPKVPAERRGARPKRKSLRTSEVYSTGTTHSLNSTLIRRDWSIEIGSPGEVMATAWK